MKSFIVLYFLVFALVSAGAQTFYDALKEYYSSGDFSKVQQFIGRTVNSDDMSKVTRTYQGTYTKHAIGFLHIDVLNLYSKSRSVLLSTSWNYEKKVYEIWDMKTVQSKPGYHLWHDLLRESVNGQQRAVEAEIIGVVDLIDGKHNPPEKKKLIPDWILTLDDQGKFTVSKPKDKSKFVMNTGEE